MRSEGNRSNGKVVGAEGSLLSKFHRTLSREHLGFEDLRRESVAVASIICAERNMPAWYYEELKEDLLTMVRIKLRLRSSG